MNTIYVLKDPRELDRVRYVGVTRRTLGQRVSGHVSDARKGWDWPVHRWIRKLLADGIRPVAMALELTDDRKGESYWIAHFLNAGVELLNCAEATGDVAQFSAVVRAKISAVHKGRARSPETRARLSATLKAIGHRPKRPPGNLLSPEARARIGEKARGRKHTPQACAKISAGLKGKKKSPEHVKKVIEARRGYCHSPETRAKMSARRIRSHCLRGHLIDAQPGGQRRCLVCRREQQRERRSKKPPAQMPGFCRRGHPYPATPLASGRFRCRVCAAARERERKARLKQSKPPSG